MLVNEDKYNKILNDGLILDHYMILYNLKNNIKLLNNKRIQGFINLLTKKEYIKDEQITDKGLILVENCDFAKINVDDKHNLTNWATKLHVQLQEKLKELTGRIQMRPNIEGRLYPFLPNAIDLTKVLQRVIIHYKITDYEKIKKTLFGHIEECNRSKKWYPLLNYYIMKDGLSKMVTDMETEDVEETPDFKSQNKFI